MNKVFIIAEAGVNHNGDLNTALKLVDVAANAGACAVKFQTFRADNLVTHNARKAKYQIENTGSRESQFEMLKRLELPTTAYKTIISYCQKKHILFLSTPFDGESADFLSNLGVNIFKIPSGEITNKPLIQHIAAKRKPIILSTGMSYLGEVEKSILWIDQIWDKFGQKPQLTLLQCVSNYPAAAEDINLLAMKTMRSAFGLPVGYSDHTLGIEIPIAAAALGASIIEKHFTLDRNMKGPDHMASLEPDELKTMVKAVRNVEMALGDGIKRPVESEEDTWLIARKSLVAARDIKKGFLFTEENVTAKRPGNGMMPSEWDKVLGKKAKMYFKKDETIEI